jgi:hypothetical protein
VRVQLWSRRAVDLMHLPDGPEIAPRDALFRGLYSELAWIHSYNAHAAHGAAAGVAHARTQPPTARG